MHIFHSLFSFKKNGGNHQLVSIRSIQGGVIVHIIRKMKRIWTAAAATTASSVVFILCLHSTHSFSIHSQSSASAFRRNASLLAQEPPVVLENNQDDDDDDDDLIAPGIMRVSEIKAELELRNIAYADCFEKQALVERLQQARAQGRADPSILQQFNRQKLEADFDPSHYKVDINADDINAAVANDGTIPGGLTPDMFQTLIGNPELMAMLQSIKMQEAMALMMTGGREELEAKLKNDPELQETVQKLDAIMRSLQ